MSKTRTNNAPPPVELLIYRHSGAHYISADAPARRVHPDTPYSARCRKSALEAFTRKYAK